MFLFLAFRRVAANSKELLVDVFIVARLMRFSAIRNVLFQQVVHGATRHVLEQLSRLVEHNHQDLCFA